MLDNLDDNERRWPLTKRQKHFRNAVVRWFTISRDGEYDKKPLGHISMRNVTVEQPKFCSPCLVLSFVPRDHENIIIHVHDATEDQISNLINSIEAAAKQCAPDYAANSFRFFKSLTYTRSRHLNLLRNPYEQIPTYNSNMTELERHSEDDMEMIENSPLLLEKGESPEDDRYLLTKRGKITHLLIKRWCKITEKGTLIYYTKKTDKTPKGLIPLRGAIVKDYYRNYILCHYNIDYYNNVNISTIYNYTRNIIRNMFCCFFYSCNYYYNNCCLFVNYNNNNNNSYRRLNNNSNNNNSNNNDNRIIMNNSNYRYNNRFKNCFEIHTPSREWGSLVIHCHNVNYDDSIYDKNYIENRIQNQINKFNSYNNNNGSNNNNNNNSFNLFDNNNNNENNSKVSLNDFSLIKVIGQGGFAKVLLVKKNDDKKIYAMKIVSKRVVIARKQIDHTLNERKILENINHPFILKLHYAFQNKNKLFFILDYCAGGELYFHLRKYGKFNESEVCFYICEVILAVICLHKANILYRDLKPENILLDERGHVRLADFGLAKIGKNEEEVVEGTTFCGSADYLAPEIIKHENYGLEVDWWALGCLFYELLTGLPPFFSGRNRIRLFTKIQECDYVVPSEISREALLLLRGLLCIDKESRIGSGLNGESDLMNHCFFQKYNINWEDVYNKKISPPIVPDLRSLLDTQNFSSEFTDMAVTVSEFSGNNNSRGSGNNHNNNNSAFNMSFEDGYYEEEDPFRGFSFDPNM